MCVTYFVCLLIMLLVTSIKPLFPKRTPIDSEGYVYSWNGNIISLDGIRTLQLGNSIEWFVHHPNKNSFYFHKDNIDHLIVDGIDIHLDIPDKLSDIKFVDDEIFIRSQPYQDTQKQRVFIKNSVGHSKQIDIYSYHIDYNGKYIAYLDKQSGINLIDQHYQRKVLPLKGTALIFSGVNLIYYNNIKGEVISYNTQSAEIEVLFKYKRINKLIAVDPTGRYLIFMARQVRGLGEYEAYFIADLARKKVTLMPKVFESVDNVPFGWIRKEQIESVKSYFAVS